MIAALINVLGAGLSIWASKEKTKYLDQLISLKRAYYAEYSKPLDRRSDAILDDVVLKLRILGDSFASAVGTSVSKD